MTNRKFIAITCALGLAATGLVACDKTGAMSPASAPAIVARNVHVEHAIGCHDAVIVGGHEPVRFHGTVGDGFSGNHDDDRGKIGAVMMSGKKHKPVWGATLDNHGSIQRRATCAGRHW